MSKLDLNALNELPKVDRILALAETNAQLEKLDAEGRVAWALDNLPGEYVLSSSFGIQAAVSLHLVNQIRPDIPVILTDTGRWRSYRLRKTIGCRRAISGTVLT